MKCSVCRCTDHRVIDTVETEDAIRRRRKCEQCGHRWTTFERDEAAGALDRKAALASLAALQAALGREG